MQQSSAHHVRDLLQGAEQIGLPPFVDQQHCAIGDRRVAHQPIERGAVHIGLGPDIFLDHPADGQFAGMAAALQHFRNDRTALLDRQQVGQLGGQGDALGRQIDRPALHVDQFLQLRSLVEAVDPDPARQMAVVQAHGNNPVQLGLEHPGQAADLIAGRIVAGSR